MKRILLTGLISFGLAAIATPARAQDSTDNPLGDIAADMQVVVKDLNKLKTGKPTQGTQKLIVAKLDELIEKLEQECQNCKGGQANANPSKPAADSVIKAGPGGSGDLHAAKNGGKKWGELPAHQREKILQSMTEGFPAHYQQILERYYKRLAEEKPATDAADADKPDAKRTLPAKDGKDDAKAGAAGASK